VEARAHSCFRTKLVPSKLSHRRAVGEQIRAFRKHAGLTQEQLAEKADLHHNFIGEVERGNLNISLDSMVKIARVLKVTVADLVRAL
jgi:XRE family transcriptional regulator, regulator of sulfur utilization